MILYYEQQVESETKYERIAGTSMGGGTFWGLGSILTKAEVSVIFFNFRFYEIKIAQFSINLFKYPI